jgi:hypothetical protein
MRRTVRVRDRCGDVERRLGRHLLIQFKDMEGRKCPTLTIGEYVSIASRRGKQRKAGSCARRTPSLGNRHEKTNRFGWCARPAQDRVAARDFSRHPPLRRAGFLRADALQRRRKNVYRRLQKEPRPIGDIGLRDQLRAAPVGVHEVWLLGQRSTKILRAPQAIGRATPSDTQSTPRPAFSLAFTNS